MTNWPYYSEEAATNQSNASIEKPWWCWPLSFSYKNHSECLPSLWPIHLFVFSKSMCCVFESFNLVDMNLVASSNRQWTWVSVGLLQMDIHVIVNLQAEVSHEASAVPGLAFFCLCAHRLGSSRGLQECTVSRWDSVLQRRRCSIFVNTSPETHLSWTALSLRDSRHVLLRQTVQTFSLFIFELCAFCS